MRINLIGLVIINTLVAICLSCVVSFAELDLTQCTVNNNLTACNQTLEKSLEVVEPVVEVKKEVTIEELLYQVIERVLNSKEKSEVTVTSTFESDTYDSVLVENQNEMKCVNDICALEKEWK